MIGNVFASCWLLMAVLKLHNNKYFKYEFDVYYFNCENSSLETFVVSLWKMKYGSLKLSFFIKSNST